MKIELKEEISETAIVENSKMVATVTQYQRGGTEKFGPLSLQDGLFENLLRIKG